MAAARIAAALNSARSAVHARAEARPEARQSGRGLVINKTHGQKSTLLSRRGRAPYSGPRGGSDRPDSLRGGLAPFEHISAKTYARELLRIASWCLMMANQLACPFCSSGRAGGRSVSAARSVRYQCAILSDGNRSRPHRLVGPATAHRVEIYVSGEGPYCGAGFPMRGNFSGQGRNNAKSGANHAVGSRRVGMLLWCIPPLPSRRLCGGFKWDRAERKFHRPPAGWPESASRYWYTGDSRACSRLMDVRPRNFRIFKISGNA